MPHLVFITGHTIQAWPQWASFIVVCGAVYGFAHMLRDIINAIRNPPLRLPRDRASKETDQIAK